MKKIVVVTWFETALPNRADVGVSMHLSKKDADSFVESWQKGNDAIAYESCYQYEDCADPIYAKISQSKNGIYVDKDGAISSYDKLSYDEIFDGRCKEAVVLEDLSRYCYLDKKRAVIISLSEKHGLNGNGAGWLISQL